MTYILKRYFQPSDIRRVCICALIGVLFFCGMAIGAYAIWPWIIALPHLPASYLWLLLKAFPPATLAGIGFTGLSFGVLAGIPRKVAWSAVLGGIFGIFPFNTQFAIAIIRELKLDYSELLVTGIGICLYALMAGLFHVGVNLAYQGKADRIGAVRLVKLTFAAVFLCIATTLSRPIANLTNTVVFVGIFQHAEENDWRIHSIEYEGTGAESGTGINILLEGGDSLHCIYWQQPGYFLHALDIKDGPPIDWNFRDAISCSK